MAKKPLPCPNVLRQLLRYEPDTGLLFWRPRPARMFPDTFCGGAETACACWNNRYSGKEALISYSRKGYKHGKVQARGLLAHRVAYAIYNGAWPDGEIDHMNGDKADNRIGNLRVASRIENNRNRKSHSGGSSKYCGVNWKAAARKWVAAIRIDGKRLHLGYFTDELEAARAYDAAAIKHHGEFANINF